MRKRQATALALILVGAAGHVLAEDQARPGSTRAGRQFAEYNCDACHVVATHQDLRPMTGKAPSFFEIANRPETTPESLRDFLSRQHADSKMPDPDLMPTDLTNIVAYIVSLRHRQDGRVAQ